MDGQAKTENTFASAGGKAAAAKMTAAERKERARQAAEARWSAALPLATHAGTLVIADKKLPCAVLENGKRVFTQEGFLRAIGRSPKQKGGQSLISTDGLPPFVAAENLRPFVTEELRRATVPVYFMAPSSGEGRGQNAKRAYGYDAMLLPLVCEVYLNAREESRTTRQQDHIVRACSILMRGFARVGIVALIDAATGYEEQRAKDELTKILEAYVSAELMPWTKMFPDIFFREIYRLNGWPYKPGSAKRTPMVGKLINKYIYDKLPPSVLPELRRLNPLAANGRRRHKHFQYLTADTGNPHLDRQITAVVTLMKISEDKGAFEKNFARAFQNEELPNRAPLIIAVDKNEEIIRDSHGRIYHHSDPSLFDGPGTPAE